MHNIVVIGDTHLQEKTYVDMSIAGDSELSFTQAVEYAKEKKVDGFIIVGDLTNIRRPSSSIVKFITTQLAELIAADIPVFVIQGQHDMASPPWATLVPGVKHVHKKVLRFGEHNCYFLDYMPRAELQQVLADLPPDVNVLFGHQAIKEALGFGSIENDTQSWDFELPDLPEQIKFVVLGDIHDVKKELTSGTGVRAIYCGSTYMCKINEKTDKSFLHMDFSKPEITYSRIPLIIRPCGKFRVFTEDEFDSLKLGLDNFFDTMDSALAPIVYIEYLSTLQNGYSRIQTILHKYKIPHHVRFAVRSDKTKQAMEFSGSDETELTRTYGLTSVVSKDKSPQLYDFCEQLLSMDEKQAIVEYIAQIRENICGKV